MIRERKLDEYTHKSSNCRSENRVRVENCFPIYLNRQLVYLLGLCSQFFQESERVIETFQYNFGCDSLQLEAGSRRDIFQIRVDRSFLHEAFLDYAVYVSVVFDCFDDRIYFLFIQGVLKQAPFPRNVPYVRTRCVFLHYFAINEAISTHPESSSYYMYLVHFKDNH